MLLRLVENGEESVERALVDRHAALIERKGHRLQFPPEIAARRRGRPCMHAKCDVINLLAGRRPISQAGPLRRFEIGLDHRPRLLARDDGDDFERHA